MAARSPRAIVWIKFDSRLTSSNQLGFMPSLPIEFTTRGNFPSGLTDILHLSYCETRFRSDIRYFNVEATVSFYSFHYREQYKGALIYFISFLHNLHVVCILNSLNFKRCVYVVYVWLSEYLHHLKSMFQIQRYCTLTHPSIK